MREFADYDCPIEYIGDCIEYKENFTSEELDYITHKSMREEVKGVLELSVKYGYLRKFRFVSKTTYYPV